MKLKNRSLPVPSASRLWDADSLASEVRHMLNLCSAQLNPGDVDRKRIERVAGQIGRATLLLNRAARTLSA